MLEAWVTQRQVRFLSAGSILIVGFVMTRQLLHTSSFTTAATIFSISLAALVGAGKLASP